MKMFSKILISFFLIVVVFVGIASVNHFLKSKAEPIADTGPLATASSDVGVSVGADEPVQASTNVIINVVGEENEI